MKRHLSIVLTILLFGGTIYCSKPDDPTTEPEPTPNSPTTNLPIGQFIWCKTAGGAQFDVTAGVADDSDGNIYMIGTFASPGISFGTKSLLKKSKPWNDLFLVKYDSLGNTIWAKNLNVGSSSFDPKFQFAITIDNNNNVIITGIYTESRLELDNISLNNNSGDDEAFIAKYDQEGNIIWAQTIGSGDDENFVPKDIVTDFAGNIYITGTIYSAFGKVFLGGISMRTAGLNDAFLIKIGQNGNFNWAKFYGAADFDGGHAVTVNNAGEVFFTGYYTGGSLIMDSITLTGLNSKNLFIAKFTSSGKLMWAKSEGDATSYSIVCNTLGEVIITGKYFEPSVTFGAITLTASKGLTKHNEGFIVKYNLNGTVAWAKSFGGNLGEFPYGIDSDKENNYYVACKYESSNFLFGTTKLNFSGSSNAAVLKFNNSGDPVWAKFGGSSGADYLYDITVDSKNNIYTCGIFDGGTLSFNPLSENKPGYTTDVFLLKLKN